MLPDSPARRRFLTDLMDWADARDGKVQERKRLTQYSNEERQEILQSLNRRHWGMNGGVVTVNVTALAVDAHGSREAFREAVCRALGRVPIDLNGQRRANTEALLAAVREVTLPESERSILRDAVAAGRSWLHRSLHDGMDKTLHRLRMYGLFFSNLPVEPEEPIRAYCARTLGDSHALDSDRLLRTAIEKRLRARHPESVDAAGSYLQEGLLTRLSNGNVVLHGALVLELGSERIDFGAFYRAGTAACLTEDAVTKGIPVEPLPHLALFVENPSTWELLKGRLPDGVLCVLTDGVPNHATQRVAQRLGQAEVPILHWGDIDAGGLLALQVLQRHTTVQPFLMDGATLERHVGRLRRPDEAKLASLEASKHPLLQHALRLGGWLEQEAIPLEEVLIQLQNKATDSKSSRI